MEQKSNVLIAGVALAALAVGVFVGFSFQGGAGAQGKIALTNKSGAKQCEKYKAMFYQGTLTATMGSEDKAKEVIVNCKTNYSDYWYALPTTPECMMLKNKLKDLGTNPFSNYLKTKKIAASNAVYCASNYPFMWYENSVSELECWLYKSFESQGGNMMTLYNNDAKKVDQIKKMCTQKVVSWAPATNIDKNTCAEYIKYLSQGVLSSMIKNGTADAQITWSCATQYPADWYKK